ncbi:MAG TPA: amidohydrolase family protein [Kineosporiaceae bacterium]|nr:amidohydrolase family protein [Kineosporiaceae bacterium]
MVGRDGADGGSRSGAGDAFERAYRRGVYEELGPPAPPAPVGRQRERREVAPPVAAAPAHAFALRGAVITPDAAWSDGYVVVENGQVAAVQQNAPSGVDVLDTGGVILPGLLDLHGHPEFNVFAAWEPPTLFANRYRWRGSDIYHQLVRDPQNVLLEKLPAGTELRYAEIRALVGGVTAIQGASGAGASAANEVLVRNVDLFVFGQHRARAMIDLPTAGSRDAPRLAKIVQDIHDGKVDAFYLHLAEGQRGDQRSQTEYQRFLAMGAATPGTVLIHASALTADQIHEVADAGCKLVWSPQSNLRLYGQTTLAAEALAAGMPVGLGADWLPSGSTSLLAEMKVARRELAQQGKVLAPAELVAMVTSGAAAIAGLADHLGSLAAGRPADVLVLERHHEDPYENVCEADPSWVELVLIGGDVTYGRSDWFATLTSGAAGPTIEPLVAWGKTMTLDNGYRSPTGAVPPPLRTLRTLLTTNYPPVGPIFA